MLVVLVDTVDRGDSDEPEGECRDEEEEEVDKVGKNSPSIVVGKSSPTILVGGFTGGGDE